MSTFIRSIKTLPSFSSWWLLRPLNWTLQVVAMFWKSCCLVESFVCANVEYCVAGRSYALCVKKVESWNQISMGKVYQAKHICRRENMLHNYAQLDMIIHSFICLYTWFVRLPLLLLAYMFFTIYGRANYSLRLWITRKNIVSIV